MKTNYSRIKKLQKEFNLTELQNSINDGSIWKFEGSLGREAMSKLNSGECMLPKKPTFDYYGNLLPSRDSLKKGTKGTFQNSANFWNKVLDGSIYYEN